MEQGNLQRQKKETNLHFHVRIIAYLLNSPPWCRVGLGKCNLLNFLSHNYLLYIVVRWCQPASYKDFPVDIPRQIRIIISDKSFKTQVNKTYCFKTALLFLTITITSNLF